MHLLLLNTEKPIKTINACSMMTCFDEGMTYGYKKNGMTDFSLIARAAGKSRSTISNAYRGKWQVGMDKASTFLINPSQTYAHP